MLKTAIKMNNIICQYKNGLCAILTNYLQIPDNLDE